MTNTALTAKIITRLKTYLPFVAVEDFPDEVADYYLTHPKGALLVMYHSSVGDGLKRERTFAIVSVARGQRTSCDMIDSTRYVIERWKPYTGATAFICVSDQLLWEEGGTWVYGSQFTLTTPPDVVKEADLTTSINQLFNIT